MKEKENQDIFQETQNSLVRTDPEFAGFFMDFSPEGGAVGKAN